MKAASEYGNLSRSKSWNDPAGGHDLQVAEQDMPHDLAALLGDQRDRDIPAVT
ncbi:MAG: hypothetical protein IRY99_04045 [Isosphaeraceae bacterium]|nr:hypothetical protein [Isosphaeraceae bacterium]